MEATFTECCSTTAVQLFKAAKVLEKLLARHLQNYLRVNDLLDPNQHGFVPARSTCSQLLMMIQGWPIYLNAEDDFTAHISIRSPHSTRCHLLS